MSDINEVENYINNALSEIKDNKYGLLSRITRYKILKTFGEIKKKDGNYGEAVNTIGRLRRAELAFITLDRYMYFWSDLLPEDLTPNNLIQLLRNYLKGIYTYEELKRLFNYNEFQSRCYKISYNSGLKNVEGYGYSLRNMFTRIIEDYSEDVSDNKEFLIDDNEMDIQKWDYEYMLSIVYSGHYSEKNTSEKRREYWKIYLNDMIKAYKTY